MNTLRLLIDIANSEEPDTQWVLTLLAALFIIVRSWKEPRCSSTVEWIKKLWYIYTMEYYSAIKNNDYMKFQGKWTELEAIILSEVTQS